MYRSRYTLGRLGLTSLLVMSLFFGDVRKAFAQAENANEPLVDRVHKSIDKGILYLKKAQNDRGGGVWNWENNDLSFLFGGGYTSLAMLALLTSGVDKNDPVIQRALPYLRSLITDQTYVLALQTMVLAEINDNKDFNILQRNVDQLLKNRVYNGGKLDGWTYGPARKQQGDGSNTQYAMLGLYAAKQAKVPIKEEVWKEIKEFYQNSQQQINNNQGQPTQGIWTYYANQPGHDNRETMTPAGISGLIIAGQQLSINKQKLDIRTGIAENCGVYEEDEYLARGLRWMAAGHFNYRAATHSFYNIYGLERVGRLSGQRFIGKHDWYREGCEILTGSNPDFAELGQHIDGSWATANGGPVDGNTVLSTSFALLFLAKGRTPILISKYAFDARNEEKNTWNNKRNDARNLVEYASRELFKKQPLAWQIYDPRNLLLTDKATFDEELSSLLQSPILYMTGHYKPQLSGQQVELLKRYIEEGGFVLGHACCGSKEFADGFRDLMKQIYPDSPLMPLRADHPVWTAHKLVKASLFDPPLEGIERGCKTIVMLSPSPLAGYWEENRFDSTDANPDLQRGEEAFALGGNIIAYATGLEAPQPRLTRKKLLDMTDNKVLSRDNLQIGQLRHDGDWQPAPQAMRQLAAYLRDQAKLDITLRKEDIRMNSDAVFDHRFMYMQGRNKFTADDDEVKNIRAALTTGGLLLADACCGKKEFDESFRDFVQKVFPKEKLQRIPTEDFLFSEALNGAKIESVRCRTEKADGTPNLEFESMAPFLEGIKIKDRWVIIYSKYDLGCALEKHKSSACKGYDFESALKIASASLLYSLKR